MHLIEKELSECTEIEKHCKELMADKDVSFFPISQSMVLNQFTQNDEENLDYKLNQLSNNLAQYQDVKLFIYVSYYLDSERDNGFVERKG